MSCQVFSLGTTSSVNNGWATSISIDDGKQPAVSEWECYCCSSFPSSSLHRIWSQHIIIILCYVFAFSSVHTSFSLVPCPIHFWFFLIHRQRRQTLIPRPVQRRSLWRRTRQHRHISTRMFSSWYFYALSMNNRPYRRSTWRTWPVRWRTSGTRISLNKLYSNAFAWRIHPRNWRAKENPHPQKRIFLVLPNSVAYTI